MIIAFLQVYIDSVFYLNNIEYQIERFMVFYAFFKKNKKITFFACLAFAMPAMAFFDNTRTFFREFFCNPTAVGAIAPSSRFLAKEITRYFSCEQQEPQYILEVGAGTGSFSEHIVNSMNPNDHLDLVELNPEFCKKLQEKFKDYPNVTVHCKSILDLAPGYQYDVIVSGLPFNAFPAELVSDILHHYKDITRPHGIVSFFEYIGIANIKKLFLGKEKRNNFNENRKIVTDFRNEFQFDRKSIVLNFPPAYVHHLEII